MIVEGLFRKQETLDPVEALRSAIAFSPKDWSLDKESAWIYGIVCGWDDESLIELKALHGWSDEMVARLKHLHEKGFTPPSPEPIPEHPRSTSVYS